MFGASVTHGNEQINPELSSAKFNHHKARQSFIADTMLIEQGRRENPARYFIMTNKPDHRSRTGTARVEGIPIELDESLRIRAERL